MEMYNRLARVNSKKSLLIICLVYIILRMINLDIIPIFNDESTYIRYGLHQIHEKNHSPYSLLIGKEPLMPFLFAVSGKMIGNLLIGARLISMLFGLIALVGIYMYCKRFISKGGAILASFLYILTPYTFFFDRLAVMESAINAVAIWSLFATSLILENAKWRFTVLLGVITGLGLWIKGSGQFYVWAPICAFGVYWIKNRKQIYKNLHLFNYFLVSLGITFIIFSYLYFHPMRAEYKLLMSQYTLPITSVFYSNFSLWSENLVKTVVWLFYYMTPPLFLASLLGIILYGKKYFVISVWVVFPLLYMILYAVELTSRHTALLTVPLIIFASIVLNTLKYKSFKVFSSVIATVFLWCAFNLVVLIFNPQMYPQYLKSYARDDVYQYLSGFSSGHGIDKTIQYFENLSNNKTTIFLRNDHGNPEDAMVAYLHYDPRYELILFVSSEEAKLKLEKVEQDSDVYFVTRGNQFAGLEDYMQVEEKFYKPNSDEYVGIYKIQSPLQK